MGEPNDKASTSNSSGEVNVDQDDWQSIKTHLFHAALSGKYEEAEGIINTNQINHPNIINAELLSGTKETALHVAAGANQTDFVRKLMTRKDVNLKAEDSLGNTAFCTAVAAGASEIVDVFLGMTEEQRDYFIRTPGGGNKTVLYFAASFGHEKIASSLYEIVKGRIETFCPSEDEQNWIFFYCIRNDLYELALKMLWNKNFARGVENAREPETGETALHVLSRKPPSVFAAPKMNGPFWKISLRSPSQSFVPLETPALKLSAELWKRVLKANQYSNSKIEKEIHMPFNLVMEAAKFGNYDFLVVLLGFYPELIWGNSGDQTIFHVSIKNRHVEIFKLIHEIGLLKQVLENYEDNRRNNLLHLVAKKPQENRLRNTVGAALQMRQEMLWYKEVEKIVIPSFRNKTNFKGETPKDLFSKEHKDLMRKSETWMKKNAEIGLLVATIIVTVIFQAAFGAPCDDKRNSSSPSVNQKDELFWSLPLSFIGGIISLFVSVTFMMVTFCLATFLATKSIPIRICSACVQA